jgi:hypothetical protein
LFHVDPAGDGTVSNREHSSRSSAEEGIDFPKRRLLAEQAGVATHQRRDPQEDARRGRSST